MGPGPLPITSSRMGHLRDAFLDTFWFAWVAFQPDTWLLN